jgi:hypothetical protein
MALRRTVEGKFFIPNGAEVPEALTEKERTLAQDKLWRLLADRARRYAQLDSSSVPVGTAQELLASVLFTLGEAGATMKTFAAGDAQVLFDSGQRVVEEKVAQGQRLWQAVCLSAPDLESISYRDTLRSIGKSFPRYDWRYFAHRFACDIDYQLCQPVPENLQGIEYINEYLRRLLVENNILRLFDRALTVRLLTSYCPDYRELLVNLCEPAAVNAVGLSLIGKNPLSLDVSRDDRENIIKMLAPLPEEQRRAALAQAAGTFCRAAALTDESLRSYVLQIAVDLHPRLSAALSAGELSGVFPPLA